MKIVFVDDNQENLEYETDSKDINHIFNLGDQLSDIELERMQKAIDKFPKINER